MFPTGPSDGLVRDTEVWKLGAGIPAGGLLRTVDGTETVLSKGEYIGVRKYTGRISGQTFSSC